MGTGIDILIKDRISIYQYPSLIMAFLDKLNQEAPQALPFLGGLKLEFAIASPRPEVLRNHLKLGIVEF